MWRPTNLLLTSAHHSNGRFHYPKVMVLILSNLNLFLLKNNLAPFTDISIQASLPNITEWSIRRPINLSGFCPNILDVTRPGQHRKHNLSRSTARESQKHRNHPHNFAKIHLFDFVIAWVPRRPCENCMEVQAECLVEEALNKKDPTLYLQASEKRHEKTKKTQKKIEKME